MVGVVMIYLIPWRHRWIITVMVITLVVITSFLGGCARSGIPPQGPLVVRPELSTPTSVFSTPTSVSSTPTSVFSTPAPVSMKRSENSKIGYSLLYPADWQVRGQVLATDFAKGAQCESVEVIDLQPPPESGSGAFILHSFVQICAKLLTDSLPLDDFMRQTYGDTVAAQFQLTELASMRAYQTTNANQDTTIFSQTPAYRIQILTSVVAEPDKRAERRSQVQTILESLSFR